MDIFLWVAPLPGIETSSKGIEHHELHRPTNGMFAQAGCSRTGISWMDFRWDFSMGIPGLMGIFLWDFMGNPGILPTSEKLKNINHRLRKTVGFGWLS